MSENLYYFHMSLSIYGIYCIHICWIALPLKNCCKNLKVIICSVSCSILHSSRLSPNCSNPPQWSITHRGQERNIWDENLAVASSSANSLFWQNFVIWHFLLSSNQLILSGQHIHIDPNKKVFLFSFYLFGFIQHWLGDCYHFLLFQSLLAALFLYIFHYFWCYPTLVGEIPQTRASISIWWSWSPDGKFYWLNQRQIKFALGKWSKFHSHFSSSVYFLIGITFFFGLQIFMYWPRV